MEEVNKSNANGLMSDILNLCVIINRGFAVNEALVHVSMVLRKLKSQTHCHFDPSAFWSSKYLQETPALRAKWEQKQYEEAHCAEYAHALANALARGLAQG